MRARAALACLLLLSAASARAGDLTVAEVRLVDALPPAPPVTERLEVIRRRIQDALVYPHLARHHGRKGDARVRFLIGNDGAAQGIETVASSGHYLLDRAAEHAVRDAAPLPYVWGRLEVPVRFELD